MLAALFFYLFAIVLIGASVMVVSVKNPVHAVLFLILAFFNAAALFVLLGAEFLAMILVVVYVGAVMVLFLFVVMMLDINTAPLREGFIRYLPVGLTVAALMILEMYLVLRSKYFDAESMPAPPRHGADYSNTRELGSVLYTDYVYPFEIASVILVVAIIAAIALTLRKRPETKMQNPAEQVKVRSTDRVRLVKMEAETKD
jgi:NADH-quinone oxidoreductase subunit J